jgi:anti-sigma factor RsiW
MKCRQVQQYLDDLLVAEADETERSELDAHLAICPSCADQYKLARRTLASIQLSHKFQASSHLKERIMNNIIEIHATSYRPVESRRWSFQLWRPAWAMGIAALLLVGISLYHWFGPARGAPMPAFSLLSQARAAEDALFAGDKVLHFVNEIVVKSVSNPVLAQMRWFPMVSVEATGKPRFHQLTLPAKPGEGFTVADQAWYDPPTGRFARVLTAAGRPVFANAYDGKAVYFLEIGSDGTSRVVENLIAPDFRPPKSPAEFLGIAAGLPSGLDKKDESLVSDAGEVSLSDGSLARVLKVGFPRGGPEASSNSGVLFTIRTRDNTIAAIEWQAEGESLLAIRRVKTETVEQPQAPWNLAGIMSQTGDLRTAPKVGITPDMVVADVAVQRMIEKADFETYIFATDPSWAGQRQITDILDIASPPHRMFSITYRGKDGRHVVFVQSHTYNSLLGSKVKTGKMLYESPKGFKVWSGPMDSWLANILLQSARATIKDPPSKNAMGFMIETPAGTFPALAVNGKVNDDELHALIDGLVPAKEYRGK